MPGEAAEFELTASLYQPIYAKGLGADICTKLTPACGVDSARRAWNQPGYPAPPPSELTRAFSQLALQTQLDPKAQPEPEPETPPTGLGGANSGPKMHWKVVFKDLETGNLLYDDHEGEIRTDYNGL